METDTPQSDTIDYRIGVGVLEAIVRGALTHDPRLRLHPAGLGRGRGLEVEATADSCRVSLTLEARMGESLPSLGAWAQHEVAQTLADTTGLQVESVDVLFAGVILPGEH